MHWRLISKKKINEIGQPQKCFFCDAVNPSIIINVLADYAVNAFYLYAKPCNSPVDKETGVSPEIAMSQLLKSDKPVGEVVFRVLRQKYANDHIKECGWDAFDPHSLYKVAISFVNARNTYWDMACRSLKSESRFFNEEVKKFLNRYLKILPRLR